MPHKIEESVHVSRTGHGTVFRWSNAVLLFEVTIKRVDRTETDLSGDKQHRFIRFGQQPAGSLQPAGIQKLHKGRTQTLVDELGYGIFIDPYQLFQIGQGKLFCTVRTNFKQYLIQNLCRIGGKCRAQYGGCICGCELACKLAGGWPGGGTGKVCVE